MSSGVGAGLDRYGFDSGGQGDVDGDTPDVGEGFGLLTELKRSRVVRIRASVSSVALCRCSLALVYFSNVSNISLI